MSSSSDSTLQFPHRKQSKADAISESPIRSFNLVSAYQFPLKQSQRTVEDGWKMVWITCRSHTYRLGDT